MQMIGRLDRAREYIGRGLALRPNDPQGISRLGFVEIDAGHRDEATRLFQRALSVAPGYPLAQRGLDSLAALRSRSSR